MNSQFRNYFVSTIRLVLAVVLLSGCEVKKHEFIGLNVESESVAQATAAHHIGVSAYVTNIDSSLSTEYLVLVTPAGRRWMQTELPAGINDITVARDIPNSLTFYVIEGDDGNTPGQVWWIQAGSSGFTAGELFVTENAELENDPGTTLAMEYGGASGQHVTSTEQAIYVEAVASTGVGPENTHYYIVRYDIATGEKLAIASPFPTNTQTYEFTAEKAHPGKSRVGLATSSHHEDDVIWLFRRGDRHEWCAGTSPNNFVFAQRVDGGYTDATSPTIFPFKGHKARPDVEHGGDLFDEWIFAFHGIPCDSSEDDLQLIGEDSEDIYVSKSSLGAIRPGGSLSLSYLWYPWKTGDPDYDGERAVHLTHPGVSPTGVGRVFGDRQDSYGLGRITLGLGSDL